MKFSVVDLFSGGGGMSFGFHRHSSFQLVAAADAEIGKPSMGEGSLQCNQTYEANMGFKPARINLAEVNPRDLRKLLGLAPNASVNVLSVCPPCTGFSRANPENHVRDDSRNSLVRKSAEFVRALNPDVVVMENARELLRGNFRFHFDGLNRQLAAQGYRVSACIHMLSRFGLPQIRERALVIATREGFSHRTLEDAWGGWKISASETTVRGAFRGIRRDSTARDIFPRFSDPNVLSRLRAIPADGGSWADLLSNPEHEKLLTPAMKRIVASGRMGSHPDVYGRMAWDRPAPTIKRECAHIGNGRYAHPEEHRLCSLREMAMLQGFPNDFVFGGSSLSNQYRHLGDAVPPLISYQLAHICNWILTGNKPRISDLLLPDSHLTSSALVKENTDSGLFAHA